MSKHFDKYRYYIDSVQAPEVDTDFFIEVYKEHRRSTPKILREDFCGTFIVCAEWVKKGRDFIAHGVDLDLDPIRWGQENILPKLKPAQQERIHIHQMNVMDPKIPHADVIAAQNFSFFLFKKRDDLKNYFQNCYNSLHKNGVLITDCFGGMACFEPNEEETIYKKYSYYWDQDSYDPITQEATFHIHFKLKGEKKREKVFVYDWRMWGPREIQEVMEEVGFSKSHVYWEGTTKSGEGNGNFQIRKNAEHCDSWIAYVVGLK